MRSRRKQGMAGARSYEPPQYPSQRQINKRAIRRWTDARLAAEREASAHVRCRLEQDEAIALFATIDTKLGKAPRL